MAKQQTHTERQHQRLERRSVPNATTPKFVSQVNGHSITQSAYWNFSRADPNVDRFGVEML